MSAAQTIAVIGAGTMGHGIAYVSAASGYAVSLFDADVPTLERGMARIRSSFEKAIERGKATPAERDAALARLKGATTLADCVEGAHIVIEAVPEKIDLKRSLFAEL